MHRKRSIKGNSIVTIGIFFSLSVATLLAAPSLNKAKNSDESVPTMASMAIQQTGATQLTAEALPLTYQYLTSFDKTRYEAELRAMEYRAKHDPDAYDKPATEAVIAQTEQTAQTMLTAQTEPAAQTEQPVQTARVAAEPQSSQAPKQLAPATTQAKAATPPTATGDPDSYWFVNANQLNVRSGMGTDYEKLATLTRGEKIGIYTTSGDWIKVKTKSGVVGYTLKSYLVDNEKSVSRAVTLAVSKEVTSLAQQIIDYSKKFQGVRYVYGGYSTKGFDCSGFTKYVYAHFGITIPRSAAEYASFGTKVPRESLRASDILLFDTDGGSWDVSHVGIYLGGDKFIHASTSKGEVIIMSLSEYRGKYYGARRAIK